MTVPEFTFSDAVVAGMSYINRRPHRNRVKRYLATNLSATISTAMLGATSIMLGASVIPTTALLAARTIENAVSKDVVSRRKDFLDELESMKQLPRDWNGYASEPPNSIALDRAGRILDILQEMETACEPKEVVPSAEGGVGILFAEGNKRGLIECSNDDEVAAIVYEPGGQSNSWSVANYDGGIKETLSRIDNYIHG
jgi:hypothetical protein